jgi:chromosome segregation ATPase
MSIHLRQDDELERTDKLPILDAEMIASIEAGEDRTLTMQVDRTILRDRTQPLATNATPARPQNRADSHAPHPDSLHTELSGIRGKIADLEGRLRASEEHNTELEQQRRELEAQVKTLEVRIAEAQTKQVREQAEAHRYERLAHEAEQRVTEQRVRLEAQVAEVERQLTETRGRNEKRIARLEQELKEESARSSTHSSSITESRLDLERAQLELRNARNEVESLQARVGQQTKAAADIARLFAQQTSETRTLVTAVERREGDLQKIAADRALRDARIAELETGAREAVAEVARLNATLDTRRVEMNQRLEEISRLEQKIATLLEEASASEGKRLSLLNERQALKLTLEEREATLRAEIESREQELAARTQSLESAESAQKSLEAQHREVVELVPRLRSHGERLEADLATAQTSLRRTGAELSDWRSRHAEAGEVVADLREGLSRRDQKVSDLEAKLKQAQEQLDAQDDVLKQVTARAESLAEQLTDRDDEIVQLNREIEEHVGGLASIRHDIERIEDPNAAHGGAVHEAYAQPTPVYALRSIEDPSVVHLLEGANVSIGRSDDNDIPIKSTSISRYHARFLLGAEGVMLADLQSTNGCYVNGRPVTRQMLHNGDAVMIGKHRFRFSVSYATSNNANPS